MSIPLTARLPVPFTPPTLRARVEADNHRRAAAGEEAREIPTIMIRVPTMFERDNFSAGLVRGGIVHYSKQQIRDMMLAGVVELHGEAKFDEISDLLQQGWDAGDAANAAERRRQDRLLEIIEQQAALPKNAKRMTDEEVAAELQAIQPAIVIPQQLNMKIKAIQQDIQARYTPLHAAFADLAEQQNRRDWLCVEVYVVNWRGLEHSPDGNGRGGMTRQEAEWLRGQIGGEAFQELGDLIFAMTTLDDDDEKNLASLIESASVLTGSTAAESVSEQESDGGSSTDEPSSPTPDTASPTTTASPSTATKRSGTKKAGSRRSRTPAAGSTSPSSS